MSDRFWLFHFNPKYIVFDWMKLHSRTNYYGSMCIGEKSTAVIEIEDSRWRTDGYSRGDELSDLHAEKPSFGLQTTPPSWASLYVSIECLPECVQLRLETPPWQLPTSQRQ